MELSSSEGRLRKSPRAANQQRSSGQPFRRGWQGQARCIKRQPARRVRLVVLGRINWFPDNVVVDLFGRLGLRWLGWGYNLGCVGFDCCGTGTGGAETGACEICGAGGGVAAVWVRAANGSGGATMERGPAAGCETFLVTRTIFTRTGAGFLLATRTAAQTQFLRDKALKRVEQRWNVQLTFAEVQRRLRIYFHHPGQQRHQ